MVKDVNALRFTATVWLCFAISLVLPTPMGFVLPVLAVSLMQSPVAIPFRAGAFLLLYSAGWLFACAVLFDALQNWLWASLLAQAAGLGLVFYFQARGNNILLVLIAMVSLLLMPTLAHMSVKVTVALAGALLFYMLLGLLASWLAFWLLPPKQIHTPKETPEPVAELLPIILCMVAVVLPISAWLQYVHGTQVFALVLVALMVQQVAAVALLKPAPGEVSREILARARHFIFANLLGGSVALLAYLLLQSWPYAAVLLLVVGGVVAVAGRLIWSGFRYAKFVASACNAFIVLISGIAFVEAAQVDVKFIDRYFQLLLAVGYFLIASFVVIRLRAFRYRLTTKG